MRLAQLDRETRAIDSDDAARFRCGLSEAWRRNTMLLSHLDSSSVVSDYAERWQRVGRGVAAKDQAWRPPQSRRMLLEDRSAALPLDARFMLRRRFHSGEGGLTVVSRPLGIGASPLNHCDHIVHEDDAFSMSPTLRWRATCPSPNWACSNSNQRYYRQHCLREHRRRRQRHRRHRRQRHRRRQRHLLAPPKSSFEAGCLLSCSTLRQIVPCCLEMLDLCLLFDALNLNVVVAFFVARAS